MAELAKSPLRVILKEALLSSSCFPGNRLVSAVLQRTQRLAVLVVDEASVA